MHGRVRICPAGPGHLRCTEMSETVTDVIELLVGLGCLAAAVPALRARRLVWLGVVLLVAGAAATVHAAARLLG